jgi:hypothetical protein
MADEMPLTSAWLAERSPGGEVRQQWQYSLLRSTVEVHGPTLKVRSLAHQSSSLIMFQNIRTKKAIVPKLPTMMTPVSIVRQILIRVCM